MLDGDGKVFAQMKEVSDQRSQKYTAEVVQRPIREAAELAWKQKRYHEVKRLYESIADDLTTIEEKRLTYVTGRHIDP